MNVRQLAHDTPWPNIRKALLHAFPGGDGLLPVLQERHPFLARTAAPPGDLQLKVLRLNRGHHRCEIMVAEKRESPVCFPNIHPSYSAPFQYFPLREEEGAGIGTGFLSLETIPWQRWGGLDISPEALEALPGPEIMGLCLMESWVNAGPFEAKEPDPPQKVEPGRDEASEECARLLRNAWEKAAEGHAEGVAAFEAALAEIAVRFGEDHQLTRQVRDVFGDYLADYALKSKNRRNDYAASEKAYRRALELCPENARILGNAAVLFTTVLGQHDEAEALYLRAIRLSPNDAGVLANYASLRQNAHGDLAGAEKLYRKALRLPEGKKDSNIFNNAGTLFLATGRRDAAAKANSMAWRLREGSHDRISLRILWLRIALDFLAEDGANRAAAATSIGIGQAKTLIQQGIDHVPWATDLVQAYLREGQLTPERMGLLDALLAALADRGKVGALDRFEEWAMAPVPLDAPWPE